MPQPTDGFCFKSILLFSFYEANLEFIKKTASYRFKYEEEKGRGKGGEADSGTGALLSEFLERVTL